MTIWITHLDDAGPGERLAVKDLFDTARVRTTYGSAVFAEHVPERTAAAVDLLENAGYVSRGKANLHEFAFGITSQNPHYGTVPNPAFPGRTAGGSSGGCAAAIAAGEADVGIGSDSGGSIRIPAACCEVVGFKPSFGLVPMDGCFPLAPSFDHAGPLAGDVAGCARAMTALAGTRPAEGVSLDGLEIGLAWTEHAVPEVRRVIEGAVGATVTRARRVDLPLPEGVFPAFQAEIATVHRVLFARHRESYGQNVAAKIERCLLVDETEGAAARAAREAYRAAFSEACGDLDLVLAPTLPMLPPSAEAEEHDVRERMTLLTLPLNAVGVPALALPCGRSAEGLPVSLQVIGRLGADALVLAVGALLEAALRNTAEPQLKTASED